MQQGQSVQLTLARLVGGILFIFAAGFLFLATAIQPAHAQSYKVIHNFTAKGNDGATPYAGPILDQFGNLYGTTYLGGLYGSGSVYKLSPHGNVWNYTSLYSLKGITKTVADGAGPAFGSLAVGPQGAMFATTEGGGYLGTSFVVCPATTCSWKESVIHLFGHGTDGIEPIGGVAFDFAGNFYGTTLLGGTYGNGTVWEASPSGKGWTTRVIYSFGANATDANNAVSTVTVDAQGNLYGTTSFGGVNGVGAIYKLTPSGSGWTESVIYSFQGLDDGQNPVGGVILDQAGNLYGTTFDGGVNGGGTVYELSPSGGSWNFTTLYPFVGGYGGPYNKLTFDGAGNLYGIANGDGADGFGSVWKLSPSNGTWTLTDLHDFTNGSDGGEPYGQVAVDSKGDVFGTAVTGGSHGQGVVFEVTP